MAKNSFAVGTEAMNFLTWELYFRLHLHSYRLSECLLPLVSGMDPLPHGKIYEKHFEVIIIGTFASDTVGSELR